MARINCIVLQNALMKLGEASTLAFAGDTQKAESKAKEVIEILQKELNQIAPPVSILDHIYKKVAEVERATSGVCVLQFAIHPEGLAMILRCYQPSIGKEHCFTDCILAHEVADGGVEKEIKRIDVLFDTIHKALKSVQIIKDSKMPSKLVH